MLNVPRAEASRNARSQRQLLSTRARAFTPPITDRDLVASCLQMATRRRARVRQIQTRPVHRRLLKVSLQTAEAVEAAIAVIHNPTAVRATRTALEATPTNVFESI